MKRQMKSKMVWFRQESCNIPSLLTPGTSVSTYVCPSCLENIHRLCMCGREVAYLIVWTKFTFFKSRILNLALQNQMNAYLIMQHFNKSYKCMSDECWSKLILICCCRVHGMQCSQRVSLKPIKWEVRRLSSNGSCQLETKRMSGWKKGQLERCNYARVLYTMQYILFYIVFVHLVRDLWPIYDSKLEMSTALHHSWIK